MKKVIAVLGLSTLLAGTAPVQAHRSGCHRWHTCPSDTGSYQMGDPALNVPITHAAPSSTPALKTTVAPVSPSLPLESAGTQASPVNTLNPGPMKTNTGVNLRAGPSADTTKLATLDTGVTVTVTACSGKWCKVSTGGRTGYIISSSLGGSGTASAQNPASTGKATSTMQSCPKIDIGPTGLEITIPANFPNPESQKTLQHLKCGGFSFDYGDDDSILTKSLTVTAPSWQAAWNMIMNGSIETYLNVDVATRLGITNNVVSINTGIAGQSIDKSAVIGLSINGAKMIPVVFDGKVTPRKIIAGVNRFYLKGVYPFNNYQYIEINTVKNSIVLTHSPDGA